MDKHFIHLLGNPIVCHLSKLELSTIDLVLYDDDFLKIAIVIPRIYPV